ncbi:hypothetical protein [Streptomyces xinghaiensis]|uniref:hypothetical protein n=1 Tax=Streptomyces xinghaiensis TaxID=1038928 RepID=UPI002E0D319E|nr:hypothetical protein OG463_25655 [Streptomyces xinghaiensis]
MTGPVPDYARHIRDAQASGLPGAPDTKSLTRLTDEDLRQRNGSTACPTRTNGHPRPTGYSCDEYPCRSTREGAYTANLPDPPFPGRTFDWCQIPALPPANGPDGWSACVIPEGQNSQGGSRLNSFYVNNRVIDKDPFYVEIL